MRKVAEWLRGKEPQQKALEGEVVPTYTAQDTADAPRGHLPLAGTDVEIVAYPSNDQDLMLLVNKGSVCVFRTILVGALRNDVDVHRANTFMTEQRIVLG